VTVIHGLPKNDAFLESLAKELKKPCGAGGKAGVDFVSYWKRSALREERLDRQDGLGPWTAWAGLSPDARITLATAPGARCAGTRSR
jgi:hypothetical protein